jgi:hypothetical protein
VTRKLSVFSGCFSVRRSIGVYNKKQHNPVDEIAAHKQQQD